MKRFLCIMAVFCLLLSGCQVFGERIKEPVTFYYVRSEYQKDLSAAIASEEREASGHRDDLDYLLALYLVGPVGEDLVSPLPAGTRIHVQTQNAYNVILNLSDTEKTMTDTEFSIACACLSLTCLELTGTGQVTISSGDRSVTMMPDNLALSDSSMIFTTEETQ